MIGMKIFLSDEFKRWCHFKGINLNGMLLPYVLEQNGVVKQSNRMISESAFVMVAQADAPWAYWGDMMLVSMHVHNRIPTTLLKGVTLIEVISGKKPSLERLHTWFCVASILRKKEVHKKSD